MSDDSDDPLGDLREEVESRTGVGESSSKDGSTPKTDRAESADDESPTDDGPLDDLRRDVESRKDEGATSKPGGQLGADGDTSAEEGHFAEMDVDDVDTEEIWADLLFEDEGAPTGAFDAADVDAPDRPGTVVSKSLCHRCQYFGDPPELHCTHEGTAIRELVDMDHYRVTDCPMVDTDGEEQS